MTLEELEIESARLYKSYDLLPCGGERYGLHAKWLEVETQINRIIYNERGFLKKEYIKRYGKEN